MEKKFKWDTPHEWLLASTLEANTIIKALLTVVDADQIQDLFQSEMKKDGYFDALPEGTPTTWMSMMDFFNEVSPIEHTPKTNWFNSVDGELWERISVDKEGVWFWARTADGSRFIEIV